MQCEKFRRGGPQGEAIYMKHDISGIRPKQEGLPSAKMLKVSSKIKLDSISLVFHY